MCESSTEAVTSNPLFDFVRRNISIALMGLMGAAAIPACSASLSLGCKTAEGARELVVGEAGKRNIRLPELKCSILVYTVEKKVGKEDKTLVEAILEVYESSPLRELSSELREYALPKSAYPFITIVVDPSGRIGLIVDGNQIAMSCEELTDETTCSVDETDHKELAEKQANAVIEAKAMEEAEAKHSEEVAEVKEKAKEKAEEVAAKIDAEAALYNFTKDDNNPDSPPKCSLEGECITYKSIQGNINRLIPHIDGLGWLVQQALVRELASTKEEWKRYVENEIQEINQSPLGNIARRNILETIKRLLVLRTDMRQVIANRMNVTLEEEKKDDGKQSEETAEPNMAEFLNLVNLHRSKNKLPSVGWSKCAQNMADDWAMNPKAQAAGDHAVGENTPEKRMERFGCKSPFMENVGVLTNGEASHSFNEWVKSKDHNKNILKPGINTIGWRCVSGPQVKIPGNFFCVMTGTADEEKKTEEQKSQGPLELTDSNFQAEVLGVKGKPVLVMFWADWCHNCKQQMPILDQLATEIGDKIVFAKVDTKTNKNLVAKYVANESGRYGVPAFRVFKDGVVVGEFSGLHQKDHLTNVLKKYISSK